MSHTGSETAITADASVSCCARRILATEDDLARGTEAQRLEQHREQHRDADDQRPEADAGEEVDVQASCGLHRYGSWAYWNGFDGCLVEPDERLIDPPFAVLPDEPDVTRRSIGVAAQPIAVELLDDQVELDPISGAGRAVEQDGSIGLGFDTPPVHRPLVRPSVHLLAHIGRKEGMRRVQVALFVGGEYACNVASGESAGNWAASRPPASRTTTIVTTASATTPSAT